MIELIKKLIQKQMKSLACLHMLQLYTLFK